jgi:hypothetical protein
MKIAKGFTVIKAHSSSGSASSPFTDLSPVKSDAALAVPFRRLPKISADLTDPGPMIDFKVDIAKIIKPEIMDSAMLRYYSNPNSDIMGHVLDINAERLMKMLF